MSVNSYLGRIERWYADALDSEKPVGAYRGYVCRNNLQHLVNVASQYRVNWADNIYGVFGPHNRVPAGSSRFFRYVFPWTQASAEYPVSLDVRVNAVSIGGSDGSVVAGLCSGIVDMDNAAAVQGSLLWQSAVVPVTSTLSWVVDDVVQQSDMARFETLAKSERKHSGVYHDYGTPYYAQSVGHMATLLLDVFADSFDVHVTGVQVREYVEGL